MKYVSPKKAEKCAWEIIHFLAEKGLWFDTRVYVNGKVLGSYNSGGQTKVKEWIDIDTSEVLRVWEGQADPDRYFDYCNTKAHFISMSFEGSLCSVLNFCDEPNYCAKIEEQFLKIFEKYGYYYELGNSWNLSTYKI